MDLDDENRPYSFRSLHEYLKESAKSFEGHSSKISCAVFSNDSNFIITCGGSGFLGLTDNTIRIWDLKNEVQECVLKGHSGCITSLAVTMNRKFVFSGSIDTSIIQWNSFKKRIKYKFLGHNASVTSIALSYHEVFLVSSGKDHKIILWNVVQRVKEYTIEGLFCMFNIICTSNFHYAIGSSFESLFLINTTSKTAETFKLEIETNIACDTKGSLIVYGNKNSVYVWNIQSHNINFHFQGHLYSVNFAGFMNDDNFVISSSVFDIRIWNLSKRVQETLIDCIGSLLCINKESSLAVTYHLKWFGIYDIQKNKEENLFPYHNAKVIYSVFIKGFEYIVTGDDSSIRLWNFYTKKLIKIIYYKTYYFFTTFKITKNEDYLVVGLSNNTLIVLSIKNIFYTEKPFNLKSFSEKKSEEAFLPSEITKEE